MEKEPKAALPLRAAYDFGPKHGLADETKAIQQMLVEPVVPYVSSVRRAYFVTLLQKHQLLDTFMNEQWPYGATPGGERKRRWYLGLKQRYEKALQQRGNKNGAAEEDEEDSEAMKFALESHLRDFLASNLGVVEKGLKLYRSDDRVGVEYPVENGRIDLLALDQKGKFVVIELKLSQGRNKTLGQLLYYMAWVDKYLGKGPCRGIIIASEIEEPLRVAVGRVPGVSLAKYRMSFTIEALQG
jgi:hypothetical protein